MCTLIDVAAANIPHEGLVPGDAGAAEGPEAVDAGRVGPAVGQGGLRKPETECR